MIDELEATLRFNDAVIRNMVCVPSALLPKHLRWLKRKTSAVGVAMISQTKPLMMLKLGILKVISDDQPSGVVGTVCRTPLRKGQSIRNSSYCQFVLEHRSVQGKPAFTGRHGSKCPLLLADTKTRPLLMVLTVGSRITVQGFISCHKAKNGLSKMVLHAEAD